MQVSMVAVLIDALVAASSRRTALRVLGGLGLAGFLGETAVAARKKRKKKQRCPACPSPPPPPPPPPFCAGKNFCAQGEAASCEEPGRAPCECLLRADPGHVGEPFCGLVATVEPSCEACAPGQVCVVLGGTCASGFGCCVPCPNPR